MLLYLNLATIASIVFYRWMTRPHVSDSPSKLPPRIYFNHTFRRRATSNAALQIEKHVNGLSGGNAFLPGICILIFLCQGKSWLSLLRPGVGNCCNWRTWNSKNWNPWKRSYSLPRILELRNNIMRAVMAAAMKINDTETGWSVLEGAMQSWLGSRKIGSDRLAPLYLFIRFNIFT